MPTKDLSPTILFTSDVHGRVGATDPFTGREFPGGIARVATLLARIRGERPHSVYLDLGDLVQGTPFAHLPIATGVPDQHPMIRILNRLGCVGFVVGNHEFNYGMEWIERTRRCSDFPWLAANVFDEHGDLVFEPVLRLEIGGRKTAILALTTPQVPRWEAPRHIPGLTFADATETARQWVPRLRQEADAVVIAAHMGWTGVTDGGLELPTPPENDVERLLREVPGVDALLMAHTHELVPERRGALGTSAVQASWGGRALGEVTLNWAGNASKGAEARTRVWETGVSTPADVEVLQAVASDEERAAAWVSTVVGHAAKTLSTEGARFRDTDVLSFIHRAALEYSRAEISSAALFYADRPLEEGAIRVLDLYRIYPFENFLTVVELTVDDVRAYLEEIARIYIEPARDGLLPKVDPRVSLYNHDSLAGCEYVLDPERPEGRRVVSLTFKGSERNGSERLSMCVSSYRACGGGGYQALRRARLVEMSRAEMRNLLIDYVRRRRRIEPARFDNWKVVGAPNG